MKYNLSTLENGITLITIQDTNLLTTLIEIRFKAGLRYEKKEKYGISHMLEHCLFKGTTNKTANDISTEIEKLGSSLNAYTGRTRTGYHIYGLTEYIDIHFNLLSDIILNSHFPNEELEKEKKVVLQELYMHNDDNSSRTWDNIFKINFENNPLESPIIGNEKTINSFTSEDLKKYIQEFYTGSNCFITVVTNISHDEIVDKVNYYLATIPKGNKNLYDDVKYSQTPACLSTFRNVEQTNVIYNFECCPHERSVENYSTALLSNILSNGLSSPFFLEMREKNPIVYSTGTLPFLFNDVGLFSIYGNTTPENVSTFIDISSDILLNVIDNINEDDFIRAKNKNKISKVSVIENPLSFIENITNNIMIFGDYIDMDEVIKMYDKISISDIKETARKIFGSTPKLSIVGNINEEETNNVYETLLKKMS